MGVIGERTRPIGLGIVHTDDRHPVSESLGENPSRQNALTGTGGSKQHQVFVLGVEVDVNRTSTLCRNQFQSGRIGGTRHHNWHESGNFTVQVGLTAIEGLG